MAGVQLPGPRGRNLPWSVNSAHLRRVDPKTLLRWAARLAPSPISGSTFAMGYRDNEDPIRQRAVNNFVRESVQELPLRAVVMGWPGLWSFFDACQGITNFDDKCECDVLATLTIPLSRFQCLV
jgi:hypothetical protein